MPLAVPCGRLYGWGRTRWAHQASTVAVLSVFPTRDCYDNHHYGTRQSLGALPLNPQHLPDGTAPWHPSTNAHPDSVHSSPSPATSCPAMPRSTLALRKGWLYCGHLSTPHRFHNEALSPHARAVPPHSRTTACHLRSLHAQRPPLHGTLLSIAEPPRHGPRNRPVGYAVSIPHNAPSTPVEDVPTPMTQRLSAPDPQHCKDPLQYMAYQCSCLLNEKNDILLRNPISFYDQKNIRHKKRHTLLCAFNFCT